MAEFLLDRWYAVAWSTEIGTEIMPRQILGRDVALFRQTDGSIAAVHDRCPHRFAPLSKGVHKGNKIACKYHGLEFDARGQCVFSPFTDRIPAAARIDAFSVVERDGIVWLWPGTMAEAQPERIPDYGFLVKPEARVLTGTTVMEAPYEMGTDNLMDLSHVSYLHGESFGDTDQTKSIRRLEQTGEEIAMEWFLPGIVGAAGFEPVLETGGALVDVWLLLTWQPAANIVLEVGFTPAGRPRGEGRHFRLVNLLTPMSKTRTRYLWATSRLYPTANDERADALLLGVLKHAFDREDKPMIEACFKGMSEEADLFASRPLLLPTDAGAVRCRRVLADLIRKQQPTEGGSSPQVKDQRS